MVCQLHVASEVKEVVVNPCLISTSNKDALLRARERDRIDRDVAQKSGRMGRGEGAGRKTTPFIKKKLLAIFF